MADDIVGSHEKAANGYGQNGYGGARKVGPGPGGGPAKANIPNVSTPGVATKGLSRATANEFRQNFNQNKNSDDARLAQVSGKPMTPHAGMRSRSNEGGAVPSAVDHGSPARKAAGH